MKVNTRHGNELNGEGRERRRGRKERGREGGERIRDSAKRGREREVRERCVGRTRGSKRNEENKREDAMR